MPTIKTPKKVRIFFLPQSRRQERYMLQFMRKHAQNWLMKVILLVIIIVFIFYFGSMGGREKAGNVATVGDKTITYTDFKKEYEGLLDIARRQYGDQLTEETLKKLNLKQAALNNLINRSVILQKAKDLRIHVSNEEVQALIASYPAFQHNGVFNPRLYQQILRSLRMSAEDFEAAQKSEMVILKLNALMQETVKVSEGEVRDFYQLQNEKTNIAFLKLPCQTFRGRVKATDADLETFLSNQGETFRVPERLQVKYLVFRSEDAAQGVKISDQEVRDYYERHRDSFKKKDGKIAAQDEVKGKISSALRQNRGLIAAQDEAKKARNAIYQEENFDEYARKHHLTVHTSEPFSMNHPPGDLGAVKNLGEYLGNLKPDQMSQVLSTPKGAFLVKLLSRRNSYIPKLAEIRGEVERRYAEAESLRLCRKEADDLLVRLKKGEDLGQISQGKGLRYEETGFFGQGIRIPKIGESPDIARAVFQLSAKSPYADQAFPVDGNYVIVKFKDRKLDAKDFESGKVQVARFLLRLKENLYTQSWIAETREDLLKAGKIHISEEFAKM